MARKNNEERFNLRKDISNINKKYVKEFFKSYNCAESTKEKFYSELPYLLTRCKNLKDTISDNGKIADIFDKLHSKLSPSTYKIVCDCSKSLCKWLNDGEVPKSFLNIKKLTKAEKRKLARVNRPDYKTLSWEDGLKVVSLSNSIQIKALILTQLDGGFRPKELERLNYGDVRRDGKFIICEVKESKTAIPRDVVIYKAATYLNRWLQLHPTKNVKDPLWIMENKDMSSIYRTGDKQLRYSYDAIRQLVRRLCNKAGFKGISLYMMRHSAVTLTKQELMGVELAAEKFGHDINYYVNTYGKLTQEQKIDRFKAHYGEVKEAKKKQPTTQVCPICDTINKPEAELCEKCNSALTLKKALEIDNKKNSDIEKLQEQLNIITQSLIKNGIVELNKKIK